MDWMAACAILNLSGPTSKWPSNYSLISNKDLGNWLLYAPISRVHDFLEGKLILGLGALAIIPGPWHLRLGLLRLFITKVIAYSVVIGKQEVMFKFWERKGVYIFMAESLTVLDPLPCKILTIVWKEMFALMNMLFSKKVNPQMWNVQALCVGRLITEVFGAKSVTSILRTCVDNVGYFFWKFGGNIICFSEEVLECFHGITKLFAVI